ncbi:MAG: DUF4332 domain-containing protein [Candidatus Promineifilaceae bacterium]|jgi:uncharacterized membrane protein/predicted flap endonuclease-1-like 5' DNA nuclease
MANKNNHLVVGMFANPDAAKDAANFIKEWDHKNHDVKLGAMAIITYNHKKDKLHYDEIGQRSTKTGAGWGTAIGAAVGLLTGGIGLIPGMLVGAAAGGTVGSFNHRSLGMTDEQRDKMVKALKDGGAGLGVMADDFEVDPVIAEMKEAGGDVSHYQVDTEAAKAITDAAAAQIAATKTIDDAVDAAQDEVSDAVDAAGDATSAAVAKLAAVTGLSTADATAVYKSGSVKASEFLQQAATPDGRAALVEETGLDADAVLAGAKRLDLMRVKGVGAKYSALLLASGVDTVPELATRNPANLAAKMTQVNDAQGITDTVPSEEVTADWVAQAKELPRMLYY